MDAVGFLILLIVLITINSGKISKFLTRNIRPLDIVSALSLSVGMGRRLKHYLPNMAWDLQFSNKVYLEQIAVSGQTLLQTSKLEFQTIELMKKEDALNFWIKR